MARRSDHSKAELRALFLASARRFAEKEGLSGVGARRIARDVGYTPGTLCNVFGSLDGLIMALRADTLDELYEQNKDIPVGADPADNLRRLASAYARYVVEHPRLWSVIFDHRPKGDSAPEWYRTKVYRLMGLVEGAIAPLFKPGEEAARLHEARVLWSSFHGIVSLAVASKIGSRSSLDTFAESLISNYLQGLTLTRATGQTG